MTITEFDDLPIKSKKDILFNCCGSHQWVKSMMEVLPAKDLPDLLEYAEENWFDCNPSDWLEAFQNDGSPQDGKKTGGEKIIPAESKSKPELSGDDVVIQSLKKASDAYEETFGYRFISFTDGKPVPAILLEINERMMNDPREELTIAARELDKITRFRLQKLFS